MVKNRDKVLNKLLNNGIEAKTWTAVHKQAIWKSSSEDLKKLPNSDKISNEIILLPIHNTITEKEVEYVIKNLRTVL